eukprot:3608626-Rhodomonas_salina.1
MKTYISQDGNGANVAGSSRPRTRWKQPDPGMKHVSCSRQSGSRTRKVCCIADVGECERVWFWAVDISRRQASLVLGV